MTQQERLGTFDSATLIWGTTRVDEIFIDLHMNILIVEAGLWPAYLFMCDDAMGSHYYLRLRKLTAESVVNEEMLRAAALKRYRGQ